MRKNFNAIEYNKRMDKIFDECRRLEKLRERINPIKKAISLLDKWEIEELKEFINNGI